MSVLMSGPCQRCGARNYQLSNAGPGCCPRCSVAAAGEQQRAELKAWRRWQMAADFERHDRPYDGRKHPGMIDDRPTG